MRQNGMVSNARHEANTHLQTARSQVDDVSRLAGFTAIVLTPTRVGAGVPNDASSPPSRQPVGCLSKRRGMKVGGLDGCGCCSDDSCLSRAAGARCQRPLSRKTAQQDAMSVRSFAQVAQACTIMFLKQQGFACTGRPCASRASVPSQSCAGPIMHCVRCHDTGIRLFVNTAKAGRAKRAGALGSEQAERTLTESSATVQ